MKNKNLIYSFLAIIFVFILLINCKKDDENPTVKDIEGNVYHAVNIGEEVWMVENLKTTRYNDGTSIPLVENSKNWSVLTTPGYCWYDNDSASFKTTYGALYNWYTVNTAKLCPKGWHVPTDDEWNTLEMYLGMTMSQTENTDWRGTDQGTQLKNTSGWNSGNGTNTKGFSALPGGCRLSQGTFTSIGNTGYWWSSTGQEAGTPWYRMIDQSYDLVYRSNSTKLAGLAVRCIRDK